MHSLKKVLGRETINRIWNIVCRVWANIIALPKMAQCRDFISSGMDGPTDQWADGWTDRRIGDESKE